MQILTVDYQSKSAPQDFARSLQETGFAILKNHPMAWERIKKIYAEWQLFFNSPEKFDYLTDPLDPRQDGYVPLEIAEKAKGVSVKDIKEFYALYFPWGRYPARISPLSERYTAAQYLSERLLEIGLKQKM